MGPFSNIFKGLNLDPKTIEEAEKNQERLNKNVTAKQNKEIRQEIKKWF